LLNRTIALESSNEAVLRISAAMELVPVAPGNAVVTARYGTLSATAQVRVRTPLLTTTFTVRDVNGRTLPAMVSEALRSDDGTTRVTDVTRIESGTITVGGADYEVSMGLVHYERVEYAGNTMERVVSRQTLRDFGSVTYDWFTGVGLLQSTLVGGLTHVFDNDSNGLALRFREAGGSAVWSLGLIAPPREP
jgi:hypothetical protein